MIKNQLIRKLLNYSYNIINSIIYIYKISQFVHASYAIVTGTLSIVAMETKFNNIRMVVICWDKFLDFYKLLQTLDNSTVFIMCYTVL